MYTFRQLNVKNILLPLSSVYVLKVVVLDFTKNGYNFYSKV